MAEKIEVTDGILKLTKTPAEVVETLTREDVLQRIAQYQTRVDHQTIDLANAQAEVDKWTDYLKEIDK